MAVYFVQSGTEGPIKIGFAGNAINRFNKIRSDCPEPYLRAVIASGDLTLETELHSRFASGRLRGEWFSPTDDLLAFIALVGPIERQRRRRSRMVDAALERAIEQAGGVGKLAEALDITGPAISQWDRVPANRVIDIERVTGVSRRDLRPDLYPPEPSSQVSAA